MGDIEEELKHIEMLCLVLIENAKALLYCKKILDKRVEEDKLDALSETAKQVDSIFKNSFDSDAINKFTGGLNP